jgi:hypothetical protein
VDRANNLEVHGDFLASWFEGTDRLANAVVATRDLVDFIIMQSPIVTNAAIPMRLKDARIPVATGAGKTTT